MKQWTFDTWTSDDRFEVLQRRANGGDGASPGELRTSLGWLLIEYGHTMAALKAIVDTFASDMEFEDAAIEMNAIAKRALRGEAPC